MTRPICLFVLSALVITAKAQDTRESLVINWPEEYKWKVGSNQEDQSIHLMELIPGNETLEKWTIMGTMMSIKGASLPASTVMESIFAQANQNAPKATLTVVEKDASAIDEWILFKIESPMFNNDMNPESQLYYIILGETSIYSNFVAIKEKKLTTEFVTKWSQVFRSSKIVRQ